ncbi:LamG-like jellyroll fold domain-containing protein, partial [Candidatus Omnitrophota bacterium]
FYTDSRGDPLLPDIKVNGDMYVGTGATISCTRGSLDLKGTTDPSDDEGAGRTISIGGTLDLYGVIEADGKGFNGSDGPGAGDPAGYFYGGTHGGRGGNNDTDTYGSYQEPVTLGSGGGWYPVGGGAIKIIADTVNVEGTLSADGNKANGGYAGAAGGSIWIVANTLQGSGTISASAEDLGGSPGGGGGRMSFWNGPSDDLDYQFTGDVKVHGATVGTNGLRGYAGTVYFPQHVRDDFSLSNTLRLGNAEDYHFGTLTILSGGILELDGDVYSGAVNVNSNSGFEGTGGTIYASSIDIRSGGRISADSLGFDGWQGPGEADDYDIGGTHGGRGAENPRDTYGSNTEPLALGSGGGSTTGGGAVNIITTSLKVDGTLSANGTGGTGGYGCASGGSVWIVADTLTGSGHIEAKANDGAYGFGGGGGRISFWDGALDELDYQFTGSLNVSGGESNPRGHAGTVYFSKDVREGDWSVPANTTLRLGNGIEYYFGNLTIPDTATLELDGDLYSGTANPASGTVYEGTGGVIHATSITIDQGGHLSADYLGFNGTAYSDGAGPGAGHYGGPEPYYGATYAGRGGNAPASIATYGSVTEPLALGSGGGSYARAGGAIKLITDTLEINGTLTANGNSAYGGYTGATGGSIWVVANTITGTGAIRTNADSGGGTNAGSGGRIAVNGNYSGFGGEKMESFGGIAGGSGAAGTIYLNNGSQEELVIDNRGTSTGADIVTELPMAGYGDDLSSTSLQMRDAAKLRLIDNLAIGSISIDATSEVDITDTTLSVSGDWTNNGGTFTSTDSTVVFAGAEGSTSNIYGSTTFYNFTCETPDKILKFEADDTGTIVQTITGDLAIHGQGENSKIVLDSINGTDRFILDVASSEDVYYVDVSNADAQGDDIFAHYPRNGGNTDYDESTPHWIFGEYIFRWNATAPGTWLNESNWTGGDSGHRIPIAGDLVYFDINSNEDSTIDNVWLSTYGEIGALTITSAYTGTMTQGDATAGGDLTVTNNFTIEDHTAPDTTTYMFYQDRSGTLAVNGDLVIGTDSILSCTRSFLDLHDPGAADDEGHGRTITVGGDMYVYGLLEANGKGFSSYRGPGYSSSGGGTHGGQGSGNDSSSYGSITNPLNLGSGGNGSYGYDSSGGGAIELNVTGDLVVDGSIEALGNESAYGAAHAGSGGSILINCDNLSGSGEINASGGRETGGSWRGYAGGGGRIAIHSNTNSFDTSSMIAYGGTGVKKVPGAAGTMYLKDLLNDTDELIVNNEGPSGTGLKSREYTTQLVDGTHVFNSITLEGMGQLSVESGATLDISDSSTVVGGDASGYLIAKPNSTILIPSGTWTIDGYIFASLSDADYNQLATINPAPTTVVIGSEGTGDPTGGLGGYWNRGESDDLYKLYFACDTLTVKERGIISANYRGYKPYEGPGTSTTGGATHGGEGSGSTNATYGSIIQPVDLGSGGTGQYGHDSSGGGAIRLDIRGALIVDGSIEAIGNESAYGGSHAGSGGSIWITCDALSGTGYIKADGGRELGGAWHGYAGGGGRVAVHSNTMTLDRSHVTAYGGKGANNGPDGAAGTVYLKDNTLLTETLIIDNNDYDTSYVTKIPVSGSSDDLSEVAIIMQNSGKLTLTDDLTAKSVSINPEPVDGGTVLADAIFDITGRTLTLSGDWGNNGTFVYAGSEVIFTDASRISHITGDTNFYDLTCQTQNKRFAFDSGSTHIIEGTLTLGVDDPLWSGNEIVMDIYETDDNRPYSVDPSKRFNIQVAQPTTVYYVDVRNSEVIGAEENSITDRHFRIENIEDNNDNLESNPRWIFGINIDGRVYADAIPEGVTIWVYVHDGSDIIYFSGDGATYTEGVATGLFHLAGVPVGPGYRVLIFLDDTNYEANLVTLAQDYVTNITNAYMYDDMITLRHENSGPITNALLNDVHQEAISGNANVHFGIDGSNNVTFADSISLWVPVGYTYQPGGLVTLEGGLLNEGTFDVAANTVTFNGAGSFEVTSGTTEFEDLIFENASGEWKLLDELTVNNDLMINSGTLDVDNNVVGVEGDLVNAGTIAAVAGDVTLNVGGTITLSTPVTADPVTNSIETSGGDITLNGPVVLAADMIYISTGLGSGNVTFSDTLDSDETGEKDLMLTAGSGNILFSGAIGGNEYEDATAYWNFNETTGTTAADATGNGHPGELSGPTYINWETGKVSGGVDSFYVNRESYVKVGNNAAFRFASGDSFTISLWVQPREITGTYEGLVTYYFSDTNGSYGWDLGLAYGKPDMVLRSEIHEDRVELLYGDTDLRGDPAEWHHFVVVNEYRPATDDYSIQGYIDGAFVASTEGDWHAAGATNYDDTSMLIAARGQTYRTNLNGVIDEVAVWSKALTATEAETLYGFEGSGYTPGLGNPLGEITIVSAGDVDVRSTMDARSFTQNNGTGATDFEGAVSLSEDLYAKDCTVNLNATADIGEDLTSDTGSLININDQVVNIGDELVINGLVNLEGNNTLVDVEGDIDLNGTLDAFGTLADINAAGNYYGNNHDGTGGLFTKGSGTLTFDGGKLQEFDSYGQDMGNVSLTGTDTEVILKAGLETDSLTIGANTTLGDTGSH